MSTEIYPNTTYEDLKRKTLSIDDHRQDLMFKQMTYFVICGYVKEISDKLIPTDIIVLISKFNDRKFYQSLLSLPLTHIRIWVCFQSGDLKQYVIESHWNIAKAIKYIIKCNGKDSSLYKQLQLCSLQYLKTCWITCERKGCCGCCYPGFTRHEGYYAKGPRKFKRNCRLVRDKFYQDQCFILLAAAQSQKQLETA
eukprot:472011_1